MASPSITVVIPVRDRASLVRRAVASVICQTWTDFELIVVDDASSDSTAEAVKQFGDPRITLLRLDENVGSNAARNAGIRASTAPLISFLDSDDEYLPHKLKTVVRRFEAQSGLDVLVDSFCKQSEDGRMRSRRNPDIDDSAAFLRALMARRLWKATPAINVRRSAAVAAGLFDETMRRRQDFEFLLRLSRQGRCEATSELTWVKHWSPGSISDEDGLFMGSTLELVRRRPDYLEDRVSRRALGRDVVRHLVRLASRGKISAAARDLSSFRGAVGRRISRRLLWEGASELGARQLGIASGQS